MFTARLTMLVLIVIAICSCSVSPTGRKQVLLFSESQLTAMGQQSFVAMQQQTAPVTSPSTSAYVQCVTEKLLHHLPSDYPQTQWEIVVFDDEQVNAFALPGGKIGVYKGMFGVAKTQHQLAAVIGHEIGHVIAQHGNERMSQASLINMGTQAVQQVLMSQQVAYTPQIMAAIGVGSQVGIALPFSRAHETEADAIGLMLMAEAGFDPRQAVTLWENMQQAAGANRSPELLATHPNPQTRIVELRALLPSAMQKYQQSGFSPNCQ